jgi:hypothetical protein
MPRTLVFAGWSVLRVERAAVQVGDLLVLRKKASNDPDPATCYLTHLMLAVRFDLFFHSTSRVKGAVIERLNFPIRVVDEPALFLRYVDPRNQMLREEAGDQWLSWGVARPQEDFTWLPMSIWQMIYGYLT